MKRAEFLKAISLARRSDFSPIPYLSLDVFCNCALDNKRRAVTMKEVASLIYGHCVTYSGSWLHSGEMEIEEYSKRFDIVG